MNESEAIRRLGQLSDLVSPMAVRVAATLRLPDLIAGGATTTAVLAERTGADPGALGRLLRHLVAIDVLVQRGEQYALTPLSEAMREGQGENRGPLTLDVHSAVGRIQLAAVGLLDCVRTGVPAYQLVHGRGFWDDLAANPALGAGFDAFMGSGDQSGFAAAYDWSAGRHVVDVGGGTGARLIALLRGHSSLRGTLVELPGPAERAASRFAEMGLGERVTVVARSFFEPLPSRADVYVLSAILHDWPDAEAAAILRRCAEALGPAGRVLVLEQVLDTADDMAGMTAFDLFMLVCCGGRERTLDEFRTLGSAAGLSLRSVLEGPMLEFARPPG
jgi:2,7-dihydroxy-5-methyl-1-naphthoate 7-O-methyltransferase